MEKQNVAVIVIHPDLEHSSANKALCQAIQNMDGLDIFNLYESPMDVEYWKDVFATHKAIVFQFPFRWASAPARLKEWLDDVFIKFSREDSVKDKRLMVVTTTGSPEDTYHSGARNNFTVEELLRPYQHIANYVGMKWQPIVAVCGVNSPDAEQNIQTGIAEYKRRLEELVKS